MKHRTFAAKPNTSTKEGFEVPNALLYPTNSVVTSAPNWFGADLTILNYEGIKSIEKKRTVEHFKLINQFFFLGLLEGLFVESHLILQTL